MMQVFLLYSPVTPVVRCYWITGLPAAGKTTLARALVLALQQRGQLAYLLDGDELRQGLCADLGAGWLPKMDIKTTT